jgi:hypothetical protein
MNSNYAVVIKHDLDKLLNVGSLLQWKNLVGYPQLSLYQKRMASFEFMWIFYYSMLLLRRIHIPYPLLKRYWTNW